MGTIFLIFWLLQVGNNLKKVEGSYSWKLLWSAMITENIFQQNWCNKHPSSNYICFCKCNTSNNRNGFFDHVVFGYTHFQKWNYSAQRPSKSPEFRANFKRIELSLKVSKFQKQIFLFLFPPKTNEIIFWFLPYRSVNFEMSFWCCHILQKNKEKKVDLSYHRIS